MYVISYIEELINYLISSLKRTKNCNGDFPLNLGGFWKLSGESHEVTKYEGTIH